MSTNLVTGNLNKFFLKSLQNYQPLVAGQVVKQLLAEIVAVGVGHQFSEVLFYPIDDAIEAAYTGLFDEVLHL